MTIAAAEEGIGVVVEVVVLTHCAVSVDAMFQTVKLPTGACDLSLNRTKSNVSYGNVPPMMNESTQEGFVDVVNI